MKFYSGFVPRDRRAWHRTELLDLLGGNTELMEQLELAENDFLFNAGAVTENTESYKSIHADLTLLVESIEALRSIYDTPGSARVLFEWEAFRLAGAAHVQHLRDAFGGVPGEALAMAARAALAEHKVKGGRPPEQAKAERLRLTEAVAAIAEQAGIAVKRQGRSGKPSDFEKFLGFVFDRVGIEVKPDSAIKDFLEDRANTGAG